MKFKLEKDIVQYKNLKAHGLFFIPERPIDALAIFTHGYTSHKADLLPWAYKLCQEGIPCALFDLPGHYLGGILCAPGLFEFTAYTHYLFEASYFKLTTHLKKTKWQQLILGGHSLGGLLALKALEIEEFQQYRPQYDKKSTERGKRAIGVGLGLGPGAKDKEQSQNPYESTFFRDIIHLRSQLVTPELAPEHIFPWIHNEKKNLNISQQCIHLISGSDDLVVGPNGALLLSQALAKKKNLISLEIPSKLAHHQPERAASFIKKYLKKEKIIE